MRTLRALILMGAAGFPCLAADGLAAVLLQTSGPEERTALIRGHEAGEVSAALAEIEKTAGAHGSAHDCAAAGGEYEIAIQIAREIGNLAKAAFYYRRMGVCFAEVAQVDKSLAVYRLGIVVAEQSGDTEILAENLHGAAVQLERFGKPAEALPFSERETALTDQCGHPDHQIRALLTHQAILLGVGRMREALVVAERAVEVSRKSSLPDAFPFAVGNLANTYAILGDSEAGLRLLRSMPNPNANALDAMGQIEVRMHLYQAAEKDYRSAIAMAGAPVQWRVRAATLVNLAGVQRQSGQYASALATLNDAVTLTTEHHDQQVGAEALAEWAQLENDRKNGGEALRKAGDAVRMARESADPQLVSSALIARGRAQELSGDEDGARQSFAESISIGEGLRADSPALAAGLQGELNEWMPGYQYGVSHELRAGNTLEALRLADRAKARVLLDMLDGGQSGLEALASPEERAEQEEVRGEAARARRAAIAKPDAASRDALEKALRTEEDVDLKLYGSHPELVLERAPAPDLQPAQLAALAPDSRTAVLSYFILHDSVALFVVRAGDKPGVPVVRAFTLAGGDKLEDRIRSFRDRIAARDIDYRAGARALFDTLIGPAAGALRGTTRWIVSPDGVLWEIPFQALIDGGGRHVLETRALSYAPSLSTVWELEQKPSGHAPGSVSLLAVSNPGLAAAERESNAIASFYGNGAVTLGGTRARASLFRENAAGADIIHIASHGETETNHPMDSFLLFSPEPGIKGADGAFTARDILGLRLKASLVVLSACDTARGRVGQGEGVLGFGWAVLAAGARGAVLSQWKVDSDATADLMIDFHRRIAGKGGEKAADRAEALRQASLTTMRTPGRQHPFYWASFVLVGASR